MEVTLKFKDGTVRTFSDVDEIGLPNFRTGLPRNEILPRTPTTTYNDPRVCARRIPTRRPTGNGKLFTGVFDDD